MHYRQDITRDGDIGAYWKIYDYEALQGRRYELKNTKDWKYPRPPIVYCKNLPHANATWGYGDLDDVSLHDALNLVASTIRKILRLHGFPQTIMFGADSAGLERGPGNIWTVRDKDVRAENLEMQSDLNAADVFYKSIRAAIYTAARMPDMPAVQDSLGSMTNFGLRVLFADMLQRNDTKRLLFGAMVETLCARVAELGGYGPDIQVKLTWEDPLPVNTLEKANEATVKQKTGLVSDETLTQEMGYTYADEQERRKAEAKDEPQVLPASGRTDPATSPELSAADGRNDHTLSADPRA